MPNAVAMSQMRAKLASHHFVQALRNTSNNPVIYARLPAAQHSFDIFHSIRNEHVIDAVEEFATACVLSDR